MATSVQRAETAYFKLLNELYKEHGSIMSSAWNCQNRAELGPLRVQAQNYKDRSDSLTTLNLEVGSIYAAVETLRKTHSGKQKLQERTRSFSWPLESLADKVRNLRAPVRIEWFFFYVGMGLEPSGKVERGVQEIVELLQTEVDQLKKEFEAND